MKTREMVFTAIAAALICISAPFVIPLPSAVPLSLATVMVYLSGTILGKTKGTLAVVIYLLIGLVGLPVFSGFTGGLSWFAGVTGGYLIGYIPCTFLTGLFTEAFSGKIWAMVTGMVLGTISLYVIGTAWFMLFTGSDMTSALFSCVVPFLVSDIIKIVGVTAISLPLRKKLNPIIKGTSK